MRQDPHGRGIQPERHGLDLLIPDDFAALLRDRPADRLLSPAYPRHGTTGAEWLEVLPAIVAKSMRRWDLMLDGSSSTPVRTGQTALVLDVLTQSGAPAILKISWPFVEAAFEHLALREWDGRGMVRLEAAEPKDYALLLERLDADRELSAMGILESCEVIGTLIRTLDRPAHARFESLVERSVRWEDEMKAANPRVPRRLIAQARSHMTDLIADLTSGSADGGRLIDTDLHDRNVLAPLDSGRGDWLAIDPQAAAGEPAFAVAPMMWNRFSETTRAHSPRAHVRMRAGIISDAAGLDEDRVRAWTFVRLVLNAIDVAHEGDNETLTRSIALAKMFDQ
ncbi:kinase [Flaviflexus salsibiostraticola]|uniref:Kinase n=1 Tax=Flaviflexus salsibiostraticola TaxID=1282737 RepID=A0A3S8Z856_9ACTO|nr:kinase [Flaviflexus salsibiostraticola]